jgi:peptide/nickel transport system substrate-binding protein
VPKAYVEQVGEGGFKQHPIGAGPYKFVSHTPEVELVLEAFEGHWRKVPNIKKLTFKSVPDKDTRLAMLKKGEADYAVADSAAHHRPGDVCPDHGFMGASGGWTACG